MPIRAFNLRDAHSLAELFHGSVHSGAAGNYSPEQLAAWSPHVPDASRFIELAQSSCLLVAEDACGAPAGYGTIAANGYIDHLYCRADLVKTGVGFALYAMLEEIARKAKIHTLVVDASEGARPFFARCGFTLQFRQEFRLREVAIYNYRMSKTLGARVNPTE